MRKTKHPLLGHSILAKTDTWLTRFPADPEYLQAEEKLFVPKGSAWEWSKIVVTAGALFKEVLTFLWKLAKFDKGFYNN